MTSVFLPLRPAALTSCFLIAKARGVSIAQPWPWRLPGVRNAALTHGSLLPAQAEHSSARPGGPRGPGRPEIPRQRENDGRSLRGPGGPHQTRLCLLPTQVPEEDYAALRWTGVSATAPRSPCLPCRRPPGPAKLGEGQLYLQMEFCTCHGSDVRAPGEGPSVGEEREQEPPFLIRTLCGRGGHGCWPDCPVQPLTWLLVWKGVRLFPWVRSGVQGQGCSNLASSARAASLAAGHPAR